MISGASVAADVHQQIRRYLGDCLAGFDYPETMRRTKCCDDSNSSPDNYGESRNYSPIYLMIQSSHRALLASIVIWSSALFSRPS